MTGRACRQSIHDQCSCQRSNKLGVKTANIDCGLAFATMYAENDGRLRR